MALFGTYLGVVGGGENEELKTANAVTLTNGNYLSRGAKPTGLVDSSKGILSMWVKWNTFSGTDFFLQPGGGLSHSLTLRSDETFRIYFFNSSAESFAFNSSILTGSYTTSDWIHILASWDVNFTQGNRLYHLYINDVSDATITIDGTDAMIPNWGSATDMYIGHNGSGSFEPEADMAEFYWNIGEYLDLSVTANRRKFISTTGKPIDLGADGSTPTGTAPIIYLPNSASTFHQNEGTGGDFTATGTFVDASTSPSD